MGKSKELATGAAYVDASGDTMTGDLVLDKQTATSQDAILNSVKFVNSYASPTYIASIDAYKGYYDNNIGFKFNTQVGGAGGSAVSLDAMTIDASGRVTMPYQVSFMAVSGNGFNTNGYLNSFVNVHHNVGGHFNNSNGLFTAPISGTYLFVAGILVEAGSGRLEYALNYNSVWHVFGNGTGTTYDGPTITAIVQMNANDYVRIDRVSGTAHGNGSHNNTYFGGYLIG